jgi:hypothetical protein
MSETKTSGKIEITDHELLFPSHIQDWKTAALNLCAKKGMPVLGRIALILNPEYRYTITIHPDQQTRIIEWEPKNKQ